MKPILTLEAYGIAFRERVILRHVNLQVPSRGCTVLLGPSGTGKSTLLRSLAGLNPPGPSTKVWGHVRYDERLVGPDYRPALVQQKAPLLMAPVWDNLVSELPARSSLTRAAQQELVLAVLREVGQAALAEKWACQVIDLPLHEQRIISILRQALSRPALLLVDEPTANLPTEAASAVLQVLHVLAQRCAVLQVSHHLQQTRDWSQHVILLADGVVQEAASTYSFFLNPRSAAAQSFVRTGSCPEGLNDTQASVADPLPDAPVSPPTQAQSAESVSRFRGPRGFVWLLPDKLAGTPMPGVFHDVSHDLQALVAVGVTRLVSLTETPFDPALAADFGLQCSSSPITDMQAPSLTQAWALCMQMEQFLRAGEVLAVHCKAGLGRTGVVLAAYWLWHHRGQKTADQAIQSIRRLESGMIQSVAQETFLQNFAHVVAQPPSTPDLCDDMNFP